MKTKYLTCASAVISAMVTMVMSQPSSALGESETPTSIEMYEEALAALGDSAGPEDGFGGLDSDSPDAASTGLGALSSDSLSDQDSTLLASTAADGEGGVDYSDGSEEDFARAKYTCLSTTSVPKRLTDPRRAVGTATVGCSGTPSGVRFRLRLEAYYGGGWQLMALDKGPVDAGTTKFRAVYPCNNNTVTSYRTVGRFFVNGVPAGWTAISGSEALYCR